MNKYTDISDAVRAYEAGGWEDVTRDGDREATIRKGDDELVIFYDTDMSVLVEAA